MLFHALADLIIFLHATFVVFVVLGGFAVRRWPKTAWLHLPALAWGALIEFSGWICPLTPLEQTLRARAGQHGYTGGFIDHYFLQVLYPAGLTREIQWVLGGTVVVVNIVAYMIAFRQKRPR